MSFSPRLRTRHWLGTLFLLLIDAEIAVLPPHVDAVPAVRAQHEPARTDALEPAFDVDTLTRTARGRVQGTFIHVKALGLKGISNNIEIKFRNKMQAWDIFSSGLDYVFTH